jgi:hypothetical protein
VWDWLPISQQTHEEHHSISKDERAGISSAVRLVDCARTFDNLGDADHVEVLLKHLRQASYEPQLQKYIDLLDMAYGNWWSYVWLRKHIEELRWCVSRLKRGQTALPISPSCFVEYWGKEGCLGYDVFEIAAIADVSRTPTLSRTENRYCEDVLCQDFGQSEHTKFLLKLFPEHADDVKSLPCPNMAIRRRLIFHIMRKHEHSEPTHSFTPEKALSLDSVFYKPLRIQLVMLALISEHYEKKLDLIPRQLDDTAKSSGGAEY